jgi:hypothetical protein
MRSSHNAPLISIASFIVGCIVTTAYSHRSARMQAVEESPQVTSTPSAAPAPCEQFGTVESEFPQLIDEKYVTRFNGTKLKLKYGSWARPVDIPAFIDQAKIVPVGSGGLLVHLENILYRLDEYYRVVWEYKLAQPIFDFALVAPTGLIYGTAGDNVMFILDAGTGRQLYIDSRNGSAAYGEAKNYGEDMCLVTDNFVAYREKFRDAGIEPMKDNITCWQGETVLWQREFPPDAQLVVEGKRILAVTKTKSSIYVNEIKARPVKRR